VKFPIYYPTKNTALDGGNGTILQLDKSRLQKRAKSVLIVEDERDIAGLIALHLRDLADDIQIASDGHEGLRLACARSWDLIILDLRLPGPSGLDICRALRRGESYVPILMLTSKASELDRVLGLETGADDYVTKPFSVLELLARVKAIFRRIDVLDNGVKQANDEPIVLGSLTIDARRHEVAIQGELIELTAREFDLLLHFASHPGRVFRRSELLDSVWGYAHQGYEHTVNSHINRLRAKIEEDPTKPRQIVTVWGVGYKFCAAGT